MKNEFTTRHSSNFLLIKIRQSFEPLMILFSIVFLSQYVIGATARDVEELHDVFTFFVTAHFPTALDADKVSTLCYNDSLIYLKAYLNGEEWASEMFKATGSTTERLEDSNGPFLSSDGLSELCLSVDSSHVFKTQYCSALFNIESMETILNRSIDSETKEKKERNGNYETSYRQLQRAGFCLPSTCNLTDFRSSVAHLVTNYSLEGIVHSYVALSNSDDDNYCFTKKQIDSVPSFDGPDVVMIMALSVMGLLNLSATLLDVWMWNFNDQNIDTNFRKVLHCFSPTENCRRLLLTKTTSMDLGCLHGIRVLSATWVVLNHLLYVYTKHHIHIPFDWVSQALTRGGIATDTFFMMSGLLVSYSLIRDLKRNNGRFNIFFFYFHRYIRIAPFYALYIGFMATLVVYLGSGHQWHEVLRTRESCRSNWWTHFLFIKNYFITYDCVDQAWYLAIDMQLFILSPLFVYPLWKWKKIGLAWVIFVLTAVIIAMGIAFFFLSVPIANFYERLEEASNSQYPDYYYQMWPRLPQYLTGILLGWIITSQLNTNDEYESVTLNWIVVSCGWILSTTIILLSIYGLVPFIDKEMVPELNPFVRVTYGAFSNFGWAVAVAWVIFACLNGYGGFVNTFLSWKGFMPLGRLTFIFYLIHLEFILVCYTGYSRMPIYYAKLDFLLNYLIIVVASFILAFFLSILIEMPFINLGRIFTNK